MGTTAMSFITALAVVVSASGEVNETCVLNETCTLQIPADGMVEEFFCLIGEDIVPVAFYPTDMQWHQHKDFKNMTSVSLEQPGRGVVLQIRTVQKIHQGRYKCEVKFSSGNSIKHLINLTVGTPHKSLQYLWMLLILAIFALAVGLLYVCCRKILNELLHQTLQTQYPYSSVPQDPPGDSTTQQNGHQNGLNKASHRANGLPNGECETSV